MAPLPHFIISKMREERKKKIEEIYQKRDKNFIVVLEDIKDKHNAGAILRSCDAFGILYVYFIFNKLEQNYTPEELTSSSVGSSKWLEYKIFDSKNFSNPTIACIEELRQNDFKIVATVIDETAIKLPNFEWPDKVALFLGNEVNGLTEEAINLADYKVYIPMYGMVQSLNVSVSAGIFLYDYVVKRKFNV
jgi:tRNA (guanosine-2'-O-)-methyltransferase